MKKAEGVIEEYFSGAQPWQQASMSESLPESENNETMSVRRKVAIRLSASEGCRSDLGVVEMEAVGAVVLRCAFEPSAGPDEVADAIRRQYDEIFAPLPTEDPQIDNNIPTVHPNNEVVPLSGKASQSLDVVRGSAGDNAGQGQSSLATLNEELASLDENTTADMNFRNNCLQNYLVSTVMPHLSEMLVAIERVRPDDPMKFAYKFLEERARQAEEQARIEALAQFESSVAEARALEEQAAVVLLGAVRAAEHLSI